MVRTALWDILRYISCKEGNVKILEAKQHVEAASPAAALNASHTTSHRVPYSTHVVLQLRRRRRRASKRSQLIRTTRGRRKKRQKVMPPDFFMPHSKSGPLVGQLDEMKNVERNSYTRTTYYGTTKHNNLLICNLRIPHSLQPWLTFKAICFYYHRLQNRTL